MKKGHRKVFDTQDPFPLFNSQEKKEQDPSLQYPRCALTSFAYGLLATYIVVSMRQYFYMSYVGSGVLSLLTYASFFYWASMKPFAKKMDLSLYSSMFFWVGFYFLLARYPDQDQRLTFFFLLLLLLFTAYVFLIGTRYPLSIFIFNVISACFSLGMIVKFLIEIDDRHAARYVYAGLVAVTLGFYCKLADSLSLRFAFQALKTNGTALFHLLTALGLFFFWEGLQ